MSKYRKDIIEKLAEDMKMSTSSVIYNLDGYYAWEHIEKSVGQLATNLRNESRIGKYGNEGLALSHIMKLESYNDPKFYEKVILRFNKRNLKDKTFNLNDAIKSVLYTYTCNALRKQYPDTIGKYDKKEMKDFMFIYSLDTDEIKQTVTIFKGDKCYINKYGKNPKMMRKIFEFYNEHYQEYKDAKKNA